MTAKKTATVELVVADRCVVYIDDVAHRAGARVTVIGDVADSLLEQRVAYDPAARPPVDEDEQPT